MYNEKYNDKYNDNAESSGEKSDDAKNDAIGSLRLALASSMLLLFTLVAAIGIVVWTPLIPEAIAVDLGNGKNSFSEYVILHESWHSIAASRRSLWCEQ